METAKDINSSHSKKSGVKKWRKVNVKEKDVFEGSALDGFLGLEELIDYDPENLTEILSETKCRKRKKVVSVDDDMPETQDSKDNSECIKSPGNSSDIAANKKTKKKKKNELESSSLSNPLSQCSKIDFDPTVISSIERASEKDVVECKSEVKEVSGPLSKAQKKRVILKQKQKKKKLLKLKEKMKARKAALSHTIPEPSPMPNEKKSYLEDDTSDKVSEFDNVNSNLSDMREWNGLSVPDTVLKALSEMKFVNPTPIQSKALPAAINHRQDVIGAAETGSGKTLAFGIPLIKMISDLKGAQKSKSDIDNEDSPLYALVMTPTRELALQVDKHIRAAAKYTSITCVGIVGGMASVKQERLLKKCPEIVVGTPGRLHQLINDGDEHLNKLSSIKFLVLDECDRMLEFGHFKEVNEILHIVNQVTSKRQVFVFSATLTLPQYHKQAKGRYKLGKDDQLQLLLDKVGLNKKAKVIDLTTKHVTASMLQQRKVICTNEDKDLYLQYFLLTHTGRTMVFVNSISLTKKLFALFTLLGRSPLQLHAGKQQRQRLKCLERFAERDDGLLITTDVAARGLDIPQVQYVVHYQLPSDPKIYIHRSGRTARAQKDGLSVILEGPEDFLSYKSISKVLKLDEDISSLDIDPSFYDEIKKRISLAKSIEKEEYKERKVHASNNWTKKLSKAMDIEYDESSENEAVLSKKEKQNIVSMKQELNRLLKTDIYPKGFSGSYPTRTGLLKIPGLPTI